MPKKYLITFLIAILFASMLYAGGVEVPLQKDGIDFLDKEKDLISAGLNRLNPPISAEEYKSLQFQEGNLDFLSAEERTYYITGGDILIIKLPAEEEFSEYEVNFEGYITLPKLGNFKAEGLTIGELEKSILFQSPSLFTQTRRGSGSDKREAKIHSGLGLRWRTWMVLITRKCRNSGAHLLLPAE